MKTIGIVCEYNPFHLGHEYHIRRSRELAGEDCAVVCVMSGDFVQRGEAACMSKFARAEAAVKCGADLVLELPLPWSVSSAEKFAQGAVYLLNAAGADCISFGAESENMQELYDTARCILSDGFNDSVRAIMQQDRTLSYAAAREQLLRERMGSRAALISQPNNILAVEYIKAIIKKGYEMEPIAVLRRGCGHDEKGGEGYLSSSAIREMLRRGEDVSQAVPEKVNDIIMREKQNGRTAGESDLYDTAMMSRLRLLPPESFAAAPDSDAGAGERLYRAVHEEATLNDAVTAAYTKRYAISRMRRMAVSVALGIDRSMTERMPPYARVLAANEKGFGIVRRIKEKNVCPVLTKPADVRSFADTAQQIFNLGSDAHDLFRLTFQAKEQRKGYKDRTTSPFIVKND